MISVNGNAVAIDSYIPPTTISTKNPFDDQSVPKTFFSPFVFRPADRYNRTLLQTSIEDTTVLDFKGMVITCRGCTVTNEGREIHLHIEEMEWAEE